MASYTLDDIRAAADAKYAHTDITLPDGTIVRLVNAIRLPKDDRDALLSFQSRLSGDGEDDEAKDVDQTVLFAEAIRTVAANKRDADKLIQSCGGDLAILAQVFSAYTEGTSAGEASASAN